MQADRDQLLSSTTTLQDQLQSTRKSGHKAEHELQVANNALQLAHVRVYVCGGGGGEHMHTRACALTHAC